MNKLITCAALVAASVLSLSAETRVGIIGVDTSHALAFTEMMNDKKPDFCKDFRVTVAYKWGSHQIAECLERYDTYIPKLEGWGVKMVPSIKDLLDQCDVVCLETCDGTLHLEQALEVFKSGKRVFIDKPIAHDFADAKKLMQAAKDQNVAFFSSSALRYSTVTASIREGKYGKIAGVDLFAPSIPEPLGTHSRYTWYGIHGFEPMVTLMGLGAESVRVVAGKDTDVVVVKWADGRIATLRASSTNWNYGGYAFPEKTAKEGSNTPVALSGYEGYGKLLEHIVEFFKTGVPPVSAEETLEIFALMDAAERSYNACGAEARVLR